MLDELADTGHDDGEDEAVERDDEEEEIGVIVSADAGAQPDAVMVELGDAVVAQIAVGRLLGTEDQARLAVLHRLQG